MIISRVQDKNIYLHYKKIHSVIKSGINYFYILILLQHQPLMWVSILTGNKVLKLRT